MLIIIMYAFHVIEGSGIISRCRGCCICHDAGAVSSKIHP